MRKPRHLPPGLGRKAGVEPPVERCGQTLKDLEVIHIVDAIRRRQGNRTAAAKELGINPSWTAGPPTSHIKNRSKTPT